MNPWAKSERSWRTKRKRAVSPIIATILLVAITVVLAAVLYILISNLTKGPGNTPIGTALGLGVAQLTQGAALATFPPCKAADYCYSISIASASGVTPASINAQIVTSGNVVWSGMAGGGGMAVQDISSKTVVSGAVAAGAAFTVTTWTTANGYTVSSIITTSMTIWLDMGTGNPTGQGYSLIILGTGSFSGQITEHLA